MFSCLSKLKNKTSFGFANFPMWLPRASAVIGRGAFACLHGQKQVRDVTVTYRFIFHPYPLSQIGWISAKNTQMSSTESDLRTPGKESICSAVITLLLRLGGVKKGIAVERRGDMCRTYDIFQVSGWGACSRRAAAAQPRQLGGPEYPSLS